MQKFTPKNGSAVIILALLSVSLLASCAKPAQPATTENTGEPNAQTETPAAKTVTATTAAKNLCDLLPMAEVSTLAGVTFTTTENKLAKANNPYQTDCVYTDNDGHSVAMIASYSDPNSLSAKDQYQMVLDYQKEQEEEFPSLKIPGVGDEAFMPDSGMLLQINALKGNVWITLSAYTGADKETLKNQIISIAKRAFEVL